MTDIYTCYVVAASGVSERSWPIYHDFNAAKAKALLWHYLRIKGVSIRGIDKDGHQTVIGRWKDK